MKTINPGRFVVVNSDLQIKGNSHVEVERTQIRGTPSKISKGTLGKVAEVRGDKVKIQMFRHKIWVERYMIGQLFRNR